MDLEIIGNDLANILYGSGSSHNHVTSLSGDVCHCSFIIATKIWHLLYSLSKDPHPKGYLEDRKLIVY